MKNTPEKPRFLSEALDVNCLSRFVLNLAITPPGSGKTYFAIHKVAKMARTLRHALYLIDTRTGKNSIVKQPNVRLYDAFWRKQIQEDFCYFSESDDHIHIMTYAAFGMVMEHDPAFVNSLDVIICDEFHNAFTFAEYGDGAAYYTAIECIQKKSADPSCHVIALTATPRKVYNQFDGPIHTLQPSCPVKCYQNKEVLRFRNPEEILPLMEHGRKHLVYAKYIKEMRVLNELLTRTGFQCEMIWSEGNDQHIMSKRQKEVRAYIIENEKFPEDIDIIICNDSCATCINVVDDIQSVLIYSEDEESKIQARGRFRGDLDRLFVLQKNYIAARIIRDYMGRPLFVKDKKELAALLNFCNEDGRAYAFRTIKSYLQQSGYKVISYRVKNKCVDLILPMDE